MRQLTAIKQLNSIFIPDHDADDVPRTGELIVSAAAAELLRLGYVLPKDTFRILRVMPENMCKDVLRDVIVSCQIIKGGDVTYTPMYPNFPAQVMEASDIELFANALTHYWSFGTWLPSYTKLPRNFTFDAENLTELGTCIHGDASDLFYRLVTSKDSLSTEHRDVVIELITEYDSHLRYPDVIPFKETACLVAAFCIKSGRLVDMSTIKTATDVLRVATSLSDGDVSLATNTKFKSFPRRIRRLLVEILQDVISEEDIKRHSKKWVRLFHSLHIGEYGGRAAAIAKKVREGMRLESFNARTEELINGGPSVPVTDQTKPVKSFGEMLRKRNGPGNTVELLEHLIQRPGEYARRIDEMLRKGHNASLVMGMFGSIVDSVPTRVLAQLSGALKNRGKDSEDYIVFPKGNTQHAKIIPSNRKSLNINDVATLQKLILASMKRRFSTLKGLGKVYIDEGLKECPIPSAMRSNTGVVARGTRLPIANDKTLRFFIYWVGQDIDLSATFYNDDFEVVGAVDYTHLRDTSLATYHSGDITWAENGACEFIDIDMPIAAKKARYVAMNVLVFSGPNFADHEKCYAGWMNRDSVDDGEVFEAKTVVQKFDVTGASKNSIPVMFDLRTGKAIWVDLYHNSSNNNGYRWGGNNVGNNSASIKDCLKAIFNMQKFTLYDLYAAHAEARGTIVTDRAEADTVFDMDSVFDVAETNSEYMV